MGYASAVALVCALLCFVSQTWAGDASQLPAAQVTPEKAAQPATDADQDPRDNRKTPLTPEEEMQRQIRLFDPLDRSSDDRTASPQDPRTRDPRNVVRPTAQPAYSRPESGDKTANDSARPADQPLAGSLAASRDAGGTGSGPRVSGDGADSQAGEYTGPAVLSRSYSINTLTVPTDLKWHESLSFADLYDSGTARSLPGDTSPALGGSSGMSVAWSFGGGHATRHDQFGFAYSGSMTTYTSNGSLNGTNQQATLNYSHAFTRRLGLSAVTSGSLLSSNYALQNPIPTAIGTSIANVNLAGSPSIQPTDASTKQVNSQVSLNWQQSARLSYNISTGYFGISRAGAGLVGATGTQAEGGANYRYSPRTTVGLYYTYGHTLYPHGLGASDSNSAGVSYSFAFNKSTQLRVRAGLAKTEVIAQTPVLLPPLVANLLGTTTGIVDAYRKTSSSDLSAQFVKDLGRNVSASVAFAKGISPGNGILFTSTEQSISASLSARLLRVYTVQLNFANQSLTSIGQILTTSYKSDVAQLSVSRHYRNGISVNFIASYTYFDSQDPRLLPYRKHISSGITWTPVGLKIWPF